MNRAVPCQQQRLFVDVSETLGLDVRTGIQRVVREICRKSSADNGRFEIVPVVAIAGEIYRLSTDGQTQLRTPAAITYAPAASYRTPLPIRIARALLSPFPSITRRVRLRRAGKLFDKRLAIFAQGKPVRPTAGERVVLADSYYVSTILRAGIMARDRGAALIALTHDVFPLTHSYLVNEESAARFAETIVPGMDASDAVLTVSDWCVSELRRCEVNKPMGRFYLGYDNPGASVSKDAAAGLSPWSAALWKGEAPVFLMVGTIASSKGHPVALAAFERLWAEGVDCKLLILGRPGWEVDTLIRRLDEHAERGRRLFVVHGASDAMVEDASRRAFAAIIGSVVEGFGLPLVEALARSLPVIASDIPVFREIAGDAALRYEQSDPAALAQAVKTMLAEHESYAEKARAFTWLDWNASRDAFALEVERLARQVGK